MSEAGPDRFLQWPSLPVKLYVLLMESLLFHASCVGMFSALLIPVTNLWQRVKGLEVLQTLNPLGPQCVSASPLLTGQYLAYDLALRLCCAHRLLQGGKAPAKMISAFALEIQEYERALAQSLGDEQHTRLEQERETSTVLLQTYWIFAGALHVCLLNLSGITSNQAQIDSIVQDALTRLGRTPLVAMEQAGLVWALQIFSCAVASKPTFDALLLYLDQLTGYMDAGAQSRSRALIGKLRDADVAEEGRNFGLLFREGGILS